MCIPLLRRPCCLLLLVLLLSLLVVDVAAGPIAYATCQAAAAAGCLTTGPGFALCQLGSVHTGRCNEVQQN